MRIAIRCQSQQRIRKSFGSKFSVECNSAVLRQRVGEFEGIELDVGVTVGESLYDGGYGLRRTRIVGGDAIAYIEDEFPVFAREILVGGLDDYLLLPVSHSSSSHPRCLNDEADGDGEEDIIPASSSGDCAARNILKSVWCSSSCRRLAKCAVRV